MISEGNPSVIQASPGILQFCGARIALLEIESGYWSIRHQMDTMFGLRMSNAVLQQAGANAGASFAKPFSSEQADERSTGFQSYLQAYQEAGFGRFEIKLLEWPSGRSVIRAHDTFEAWMMLKHGQLLDEKEVCAYTTGVLTGFMIAISGRQDVVCLERHCQAQGADACEFDLIPVNQNQ